MRIERPARKRGRIGLTPLIDVVFLLLVFFMLASTFFRYTGADLASGRGGAVHNSDVNNLVIVRVKGGSNIDVNGKPVALEQLKSELASLASGEGIKVAIKALHEWRAAEYAVGVDDRRVKKATGNGVLLQLAPLAGIPSLSSTAPDFQDLPALYAAGVTGYVVDDSTDSIWPSVTGNHDEPPSMVLHNPPPTAPK